MHRKNILEDNNFCKRGMEKSASIKSKYFFQINQFSIHHNVIFVAYSGTSLNIQGFSLVALGSSTPFHYTVFYDDSLLSVTITQCL